MEKIEKPKFFDTKNQKTNLKLAKTAKPKIPMPFFWWKNDTYL